MSTAALAVHEAGTESPKLSSSTVRWTKPGGLTPLPQGKGNRSPTLTQLNQWFSENYGQIVTRAEENCLRLTGKRHL